MTELERNQIKILREQGLGYKAISNRTGLSVGSLRHFLKTEEVEVNKSPEGFCLNCNKPIKQNRKFCSRECGLMWWHSHTEFLYKRAFYTFITQAKVIRTIFLDYLSGLSPYLIAKKLNDEGIKSLRGGHFHESHVWTILRLEKYKGDSLLQKTFIHDF